MVYRLLLLQQKSSRKKEVPCFFVVFESGRRKFGVRADSVVSKKKESSRAGALQSPPNSPFSGLTSCWLGITLNTCLAHLISQKITSNSVSFLNTLRIRKHVGKEDVLT